jgi:hypothetical protein
MDILFCHTAGGGEIMEISRRKRECRYLFFFLILIFVLSIVSCASSKTYWLFLRPNFIAQEGSTPNLTVGIVPFEDNRPNPQKLGQRVLASGKVEPIRLGSDSPSQEVTSILRELLKARGIRTIELAGWEPASANLKDIPDEVDIAMAGFIEALQVEALSYTLQTNMRYVVKLTAKFGIKAKGQLVTKKVDLRPEEIVGSFKRKKVEAVLNETLSSVLDNIIEAAISAFQDN